MARFNCRTANPPQSAKPNSGNDSATSFHPQCLRVNSQKFCRFNYVQQRLEVAVGFHPPPLVCMFGLYLGLRINMDWHCLVPHCYLSLDDRPFFSAIWLRSRMLLCFEGLSATLQLRRIPPYEELLNIYVATRQEETE